MKLSALDPIQHDPELASDLEGLVLRELLENKAALSLKEIHMKIVSARPVTAIEVAAVLDRLYRKRKVSKVLVGSKKSHYVYSAASTAGEFGQGTAGKIMDTSQEGFNHADRANVAKERTIYRGVRIPRSIDDRLKDEATEDGGTLSSVIVSILTNHVEWDKIFARAETATVTKRALRLLIDSIEADRMNGLGRELGKGEWLTELLQSLFRRVDLDDYLSLIRRYCIYSGIVQCEESIERSTKTISLKHDLGEAWSRFLKGYIEKAVADTFHISLEVEITSNSIFVRFLATDHVSLPN